MLKRIRFGGKLTTVKNISEEKGGAMNTLSKEDFVKNVNDVEERLNINFPQIYVDYLYDHIETPWNMTINIESQSYCFEWLFTFVPFDELDILDKYNENKNFVGFNTIPISCTKNALLCLKFSSAKEYEIILYKENGFSVVLGKDISLFLH
jgi:hypothetical protein